MTKAGYAAVASICRTLINLPTDDEQDDVMRAVKFLTNERTRIQTKGPTMNDSQPEHINTTAVIPPADPTLADVCNLMRVALSDFERGVRALVTQGKVDGEAAAQAMLTVRHLEDARMRLGKVIQYGVNGGVSVYDGKTVP